MDSYCDSLMCTTHDQYICGFDPAMNIINMHTSLVVCKHAISLEVCCHTLNLAHQIRCSKHTKPLGVITRLWRTRLLHTKYGVLRPSTPNKVCYTFSGWCDIPPMVCCSFGGHSTPQFLQCEGDRYTHKSPHTFLICSIRPVV